MSKSTNNYDLLIGKLDEFIRKFYVNRLIRGALYSVGVILGLFLLFAALEYFFEFSSGVRTSMYYGFILTSLASLGYWVLMPLLNYFRLGRVISHEQAANIIGQHFGNVQDKLLNILQLKQKSAGYSDASLINASIDQKIETLKPVPFSSAINLSGNKKYAKYALIPLCLLALVSFAYPALITDSTERIIQHDREFEKEAPFSFELLTDDLEVVQFEDLKVEVKVNGDILPETAYININKFPYKLVKERPNLFTYKFNKLQKNTSFFVEADGFSSEDYDITVIPKPSINGFEVALDYPGYTGKKDEVLKNTGDVLVPAGTKMEWKFEASNTDEVAIKFAGVDTLVQAHRQGEEYFTFNKRIYTGTPYTVFISSDKVPMADSIAYSVNVTPDMYPAITAEQFIDTTNNKIIYFRGEATDDYGISELKFVYNVTSKTSPNKGLNSEAIDRGVNPKGTSFTHYLDVETLALDPGDELTYYFEVWDNDAVNGRKFARSQTLNYELPTLDEMEDLADSNNDALKDDMSDSLKEIEELQKDIQDMKEKMVDKEELEWEDKEELEKMLEKQKEAQQQVEQMQKNFQKNLEKQQEYKEFTPSVMEKQQKLQQMFEDMLSPEQKEMLEKMEEKMEEMTQEEIMEQLEEMELTDEQLQKELERMMELFKQLEYEMKMTETIEKLEELGEEQEELGEETEESDGSKEEMEEQKEEQEEINEEMEEIMKDIAELEEMNEEINEEEESMDETQELGEEAQEEQEQSMEDMENQDSKSAGEKQKSAGQKMQEMAQQMQQQMMDQQQEQGTEDMQAIRQLLENLIDLSIDQEDVMDRILAMDVNNAKYIELVQEQYSLKDDAQLVEDSLIALSKRVFEIEAYVTKELTEMGSNMEDAIENLEARKKDYGTINQQYVMTSINNLALMLDESLQKMQQQMAQQMDGNQNCSGSCNKPGGSGMGKLGKMQKQLNDKMSAMSGKMGGKKPGKGQMSREVAEMAAQQSAIRDALRKITQEMNKDGRGDGSLEELMKEMEQTEEDLVNKRLTSQMIARQQDILTRLLEAEKAERERELDEKRESNTARNMDREIPPSIEEYLKKRNAEVELYKTLPPDLKPYYKSLVEKYFKAISF